MSTQHRITFPFQARYHQIGTAGPDTTDILFALHGHGQLAQYFIRKFSCLDNGHTVIYAPEGLSRYYLEGYTGRVGATWMTKEDRENDILNYNTYLDTLYKSVCSAWPEQAKIHLLGFSQGAATVTRWLLNGNIHADRLILWAGILPFDMNIQKSKEVFSHMETLNVYGTRDPYLNDETSKEMTALAEKSGGDFEYIPFDGEHVIHEQTLMDLFNRGERS